MGKNGNFRHDENVRPILLCFTTCFSNNFTISQSSFRHRHKNIILHVSRYLFQINDMHYDAHPFILEWGNVHRSGKILEPLEMN